MPLTLNSTGGRRRRVQAGREASQCPRAHVVLPRSLYPHVPRGSALAPVEHPPQAPPCASPRTELRQRPSRTHTTQSPFTSLAGWAGGFSSVSHALGQHTGHEAYAGLHSLTGTAGCVGVFEVHCLFLSCYATPRASGLRANARCSRGPAKTRKARAHDCGRSHRLFTCAQCTSCQGSSAQARQRARLRVTPTQPNPFHPRCCSPQPPFSPRVFLVRVRMHWAERCVPHGI